LIVGFLGGRLLAPDGSDSVSNGGRIAEAAPGRSNEAGVASNRSGARAANRSKAVDSEVEGRPLSAEWFAALETLDPLDRIGHLVQHLKGARASEYPAIIESLESGDYGRMGREMRGILETRWAEVDPQGMLAYALEQPRSRSRRIFRPLFTAWAKRDVSAAFTAARQLDTRNEQRMAVQSVINSVAGEQPERAIEMARDFYGENLPHRGQWVFRSIFQNWAREDGEAATFAYISREVEADTQGTVLQRAYNKWARSDPEAAIAWLDRLPEGAESQRSSIYRSVANAYIRHDPMAASEWISGLDEGPERDQSVERLVNSIAKTDPEAGFIWAATMDDASKRKNSLRRSLQAWKETDPESARRAIVNADIEAEEKEPLLKLFE
jgi:hypothetical protein